MGYERRPFHPRVVAALWRMAARLDTFLSAPKASLIIPVAVTEHLDVQETWEGPYMCALTATEGQEYVGNLECFLSADETELVVTIVNVELPHRNRGVATALYARLVQTAAKAKVKFVVGHVSNPAILKIRERAFGERTTLCYFDNAKINKATAHRIWAQEGIVDVVSHL